jgi:rhodanese-related sulfurtransferase
MLGMRFALGLGAWMFVMAGCGAGGGVTNECVQCLSNVDGSSNPVDAAHATSDVSADDSAASSGGSSGDASAPDASMGDSGTTVGTDGASDAGIWPPSCQGLVDGAIAQTLVQRGALLIDVRTASEYAAGHVTDAINIPVADLPARLGELDATVPVVVYCQSGGRATQAAATLCSAGFSAYNLGPMANWPG